jgi:hypothetical protein
METIKIMGNLDLTNLAALKSWLNVSGTTNADQALQGMLTRVSGQVIGYLERSSFISQNWVDILDGNGGDHQFMEKYPVTAISQVIIGNQIIPVALSVAQITANSTPGTPGVSGPPPSGFRWEDWDNAPPGEPQAVELIGYRFWKGKQNVQINYTAGYLAAAEAQTVAASSSGGISTYGFVTNQPWGTWIADSGMSYASSGDPLTYVSALTGTAGQYTLDPDNVGGYLLNAADVAASVQVSYSWCPGAVEQVVLDMCNEIWARRNRPGASARGLAGQETGTYEVRYGIPPWAAMMLQPFKNVIPI